MTTGRTIWDYITEHPWFLLVILVLALIMGIVLFWGLGYRLSPSLGWFVKKEIGAALDRRFAQAYIDTRDLKDSHILRNVKGVNIDRVEYHENPRRYTVYFKEPFPSEHYVAVANSTRGFVHITINRPESVSLVDYDVIPDCGTPIKL